MEFIEKFKNVFESKTQNEEKAKTTEAKTNIKEQETSKEIKNNLIAKIEKNFDELGVELLSTKINTIGETEGGGEIKKITLDKKIGETEGGGEITKQIDLKSFKEKIENITENLKKEISENNELDEKTKKDVIAQIRLNSNKLYNELSDTYYQKTPKKTEEEVLKTAKTLFNELEKEEKAEKTFEESVTKIHDLAEKYASEEQNSDDSIRQAIKLVYELSETTDTQPKIIIQDLINIFTDGDKKINEFYQKILDLFNYNSNENSRKTDPNEKTQVQGPALDLN